MAGDREASLAMCIRWGRSPSSGHGGWFEAWRGGVRRLVCESEWAHLEKTGGARGCAACQQVTAVFPDRMCRWRARVNSERAPGISRPLGIASDITPVPTPSPAICDD